MSETDGNVMFCRFLVIIKSNSEMTNDKSEMKMVFEEKVQGMMVHSLVVETFHSKPPMWTSWWSLGLQNSGNF